MDIVASKYYQEFVTAVISDSKARQLLNGWIGALRTSNPDYINKQRSSLEQYLASINDSRHLQQLINNLATEIEDKK